TAHAPSARRYCHTVDRDRGGEVNNHLIIVCGSAAAAFDAHCPSEGQRNIKSAGSAVHLSRESALGHRSRLDIDRAPHAECTVRGAVVGVSASLRKGVLINRANV